jgi:hypothetical protein
MNKYTVTDKGKPIATGITRQQVMDLLNITTKAVDYYTRKDSLYLKRYRIIQEDAPPKVHPRNITADLKRDWDNMCRAAELLRTGKGHIVTKRVNGKLIKCVEVIK